MDKNNPTIETKFSVQDKPQNHDEFVQKAINTLKNEGYLVLENVFPVELIETWRKEFEYLFNQKIQRFQQIAPQKSEQGNHDINRWNMHIPTKSALFGNELIANEWIMAVLEGVLGKSFVPVFIASDIALPQSQNQSIHQDGSDLSIAVNIPLVDVRIENGATEIWAKTHLRNQQFTHEPMELSDSEIEEWVQKIPSQFLEMQQGSVSIRDMRMLHRGTVNQTSQMRPLLSIIYMPVEEEKVPYQFLLNYFAKKAKKQRELAWKLQQQDLLDVANTLGRMIDLYAHSDRDYRRKISNSVYQQLDAKARFLLRFADREKEVQNEYRIQRSWKMSWQFLKDALQQIRLFRQKRKY